MVVATDLKEHCLSIGIDCSPDLGIRFNQMKGKFTGYFFSYFPNSDSLGLLIR